MSHHVKRKEMRRPAMIFLVIASIILGGFSWFVANDLTSRIEANTRVVVDHTIPIKDMGWVSAQVDGTIVHLSGDAPDQIARVRVAEALAKEINVSRIVNDIKAPDLNVKAPEVRIEIVQNDKVSSIIGLLPREPSPVPLYRAINRAKPLLTTLNLVEDTTADPGDAWGNQLDFISLIVSEIPNVKVSATPGIVNVYALAESEDIATSLRKKLTDVAPDDVNLQLNISSPRTMIAPFTFSLLKDGDEVTLSACSATDRDDLVAMRAAFRGLDTTAMDACKLGLGAPTEKWGELISSYLLKFSNDDRFALTVRDNQIIAKISDQLDDKERAAKIKELKSIVPAGFGIETELLTTKRTIDDLKADGEELKLVFEKAEDGAFSIDGVLGTKSSIESLKGFAIAKFGTENVNFNVDLVEGLPSYWEKNAFTTLQVIAGMNVGEIVSTKDQILLKGNVETGEIRADLEKILKEEISDVQVSQNITVNIVTKKEEPEIGAAICVEEISDLLTSSPIQFEKSSTSVAESSMASIKQIAEILQQCRKFQFEIGGHTDSRGGEELNRNISEKRAKSVLDSILETGLDFGELTSKGFGPAEPVASNETEEGRAQNRRIEIRLIAESGE